MVSNPQYTVYACGIAKDSEYDVGAWQCPEKLILSDGRATTTLHNLPRIGFHFTRQSGHTFYLLRFGVRKSPNTTSLFGNMKSITISPVTLPSLI